MEIALRRYSPVDPRVTVHGRTVPGDPLPLFWTGSGVEFETDSAQLVFEFETEFETREQWIRVELDGATVLRTPLERGWSRVCVYREMASGDRRRVRLYKEVQPMPRDPSSLLLLRGIWCDGEIFAVPPRPLRLEFVGDSISSGEGLAGAASIKDGVSMIFSTQGHYAVEAAHQLNADFRILSQSGWGVAAGWDNDIAHAMPLYYEQVCGVIPGPAYAALGAHQMADLSAWIPDVVVIHLGYNDGFALSEPEWHDPISGRPFRVSEEFFCQKVINFLTRLRKHHPNTPLIWLYGMFGQTVLPWLEKAIQQYQQTSSDSLVHLILLPDTPSDQLGSNNHPGVLAHKAVADILVDAIQKIVLDRAAAK